MEKNNAILKLHTKFRKFLNLKKEVDLINYKIFDYRIKINLMK